MKSSCPTTILRDCAPPFRGGQRLAGRVGYAKKIPLTNNQSIGLELVVDAGKVWGNAPAQSRFFGSNLSGQFLYDSPSSTTLLNMSVGPILCSFGESQADLLTTGSRCVGDAFWQVNLNLTFPIPSFSRAIRPRGGGASASDLTSIEFRQQHAGLEIGVPQRQQCPDSMPQDARQHGCCTGQTPIEH